MVVVDDAEPAARQLRIEILQTIHRALVKIPIQPDQRERLGIEFRQRLRKISLRENHLLIQQSIAREIRPHAAQARVARRNRHPVAVLENLHRIMHQLIAGIARIGQRLHRIDGLQHAEETALPVASSIEAAALSA